MSTMTATCVAADRAVTPTWFNTLNYQVPADLDSQPDRLIGMGSLSGSTGVSGAHAFSIEANRAPTT